MAGRYTVKSVSVQLRPANSQGIREKNYRETAFVERRSFPQICLRKLCKSVHPWKEKGTFEKCLYNERVHFHPF